MHSDRRGEQRDRPPRDIMNVKVIIPSSTRKSAATPSLNSVSGSATATPQVCNTAYGASIPVSGPQVSTDAPASNTDKNARITRNRTFREVRSLQYVVDKLNLLSRALLMKGLEHTRRYEADCSSRYPNPRHRPCEPASQQHPPQTTIFSHLYTLER